MGDDNTTPVDGEVLYNLLEKHKARPSVQGIDWARDNWYNLQSVTNRISALQKDAKLRAGKGKSIICAGLGASLVVAVKARDRQRSAESQTIQCLQALVQTLQGQIENLKGQLEQERAQADYLQSALKEQLLMGESGDSHSPPKKKIIYPCEELEEMKLRLDKLEMPPHSLRPLVKTEFTYDNDQDDSPQITTKEVPYTATELAKLKKEFGRTAKESETEYVWRVSLSGGDQILLSEKEAEGYWGPGVFLTTSDHRAPWSLTQRAAYWAGGLNPLERGDPLAITGSTDQLVENVQKVACLQMMYDRELKLKQESPMMMPVDPERMTPLIRGLPKSLKPLGIQLQNTINATPQGERVSTALAGLVTSDRRNQNFKVWTWEDVAQELINYGRKYGPVSTPSPKSDLKGLRRTEIKPPSHFGNEKRVSFIKLSGGRNIPYKRDSLWTIGCRKGVPQDLMDGLPTDRLEKLVLEWPEKPVAKVKMFESPVPSAPPHLIDLTDSTAPQRLTGN
ncbi:uncharacterized protein LJ206_014311 [Theristicus caerulescens]